MALRTSETPNAEDKSHIDDVYDNKFNRKETVARDLEGDEKKAGEASGNSEENSDIRTQEEQGGKSDWATNYQARDSSPKKFSAKAILNKKNGPMALIIGLLVAAIFGFTTTAPAFLLIHMGEIITNKFNVQETSLGIRANKIVAKQLNSEATKGICTQVTKALCGFEGISQRQKDIFEKAGVKVNAEKTPFGRYKPSSFEVYGKPPISAASFRTELQNDPRLREVAKKAYNHRFASIADNTAAKVFARFKTSRANPFPDRGATDEERDEHMKKQVNEGNASGNVGSKYVYDEETKEWKNANGEVVDEATALAHNARVDVEGDLKEGVDTVAENVDKASDDILRDAERSLSSGTLDKVTGFFKLTSVADSGCAINGAVQAVSYGAKVVRAAQMARYAMIFLSTASMIKAGDATPEDVAYLGNILTKTVNTTAVDDKGKEILTTTKAATDSYGFRYAAYGDSGPLTPSASQFLAGGGMSGKVSSVYNTIVDYLGGKQKVNDVCGVVKNPFVQTGNLIAGVVLTVFTFGVGKAVFEVAESAAIATAMSVVGNILMSYLQDIIAGVLIDKNTFGELSGDAIVSGSGVLLSSIGGVGGNAPLHPEEAVAYNNMHRQVLARNTEEDRATLNPLDASSPNTFLGQIIFQLLPLTSQVSSPSGAVTKPTSVVSRSLSAILTPPALAEDTVDDYTQCQDIDYRKLNLATDPFCNPIRGIPGQYLESDPVEVAKFMIDLEHIDGATGAPKSTEYQDFLKNCIDREAPLGYSGESVAWDGHECFIDDQKEAFFYLYRMDTRVIDGMDNGYDTGSGNCAPTGTSSPAPSTGTSGGAKVSDDQLKSLITSYGLPAPTEQGANGYKKLYDQLVQNPDAAWAAKSMLAGEKNFKSKGGNVKEYLNTAWLWFENGSSSWPDPYQINCNDNRPGYVSEVSFFCGVVNFQSSGYQAENRKNDYVEMYKKFYSDGELASILQRIAQDSSKASKEIWKYDDPGQQKGLVSSYKSSISSATLSDISPNKSFSDQKGQFLTLLLGKDPNISTALNSFAVSDGDLVRVLKESGCGYGYICEGEKQLLSNMIMALYQLDEGSTGNFGGCSSTGGTTTTGGGVGLSAIWGGEGTPLMYPFGPNSDNGLYGYGTAYGLNGLQHTGTDIVLDPEAPIYSPVPGTIRCTGTGKGPGTNGGGCAAFNDYAGSGNGRVEIEMDNGYVLILGHTSKGLTQVGQRVKPGDQVATNGFMNSWHVHVECRTPEPSLPAGWRIVDPSVCVGGSSPSAHKSNNSVISSLITPVLQYFRIREGA
jgi:murein DD-endopeptidase MepM/ murein hydrolase activator NlpD